MVKGLFTAYTGMVEEQRRLDVISNNLANAATNGFKKEGITSQSFSDELAIKIKDTSAYNLNRKIGLMNLGVKVGETYTDYSQGSYDETGNETDLALAGDGFFAISFTDKQGNTSVKYTRDGAFTLNAQGYLVTKDGDYVLNANGAMNSDPGQANFIQLDPNQTFAVNELGQIYQNGALVGEIGVVSIADTNFLEHYGENMYQLVEGGQVVASDALVNQGFIEMSNVNVVNEMVDMITIARAYQAGQKVINAVDETLDKAVNQVGLVK